MVTLEVPVAGPLLDRMVRRCLLKVRAATMEADFIWDTVEATFRPVLVPSEVRALTVVSEIHRVTSVAVPPRRDLTVLEVTPCPAPTTVTLRAPVAGLLEATSELRVSVEKVRAFDSEPTLRPTVRPTVMALNTPCGAWQSREDSEIQAVFTEAVPRMRAPTERASSPKERPTRVTWAAPVLGRFEAEAEEMTGAKLITEFMVTARRPEETLTPLTPSLFGKWPRRELSEVHIVTARPVAPRRPLRVSSPAPNEEPTTVTLMWPVDGELVMTLLLRVARSWVKMSARVPRTRNMVTTRPSMLALEELL
mmetsp:Transcript_20909/g.48890  ORF Transcript_20909/g.48890 Transcript_20909/m.48890 type:complete len:308 (+) Transcript_20909:5273-6196(+)